MKEELVPLTPEAEKEHERDIAYKAGMKAGFILSMSVDAKLLQDAEVAELNERAKSFLEEIKRDGKKEVVEWIKSDNIELWEEWTDKLYGWKIHKLDMDTKIEEWGIE